ncbi:MAG TPA: SDR family NAD(P)-dependent oxidoreductase [Solirubrobacteraceae bacterium]|nr:SDR family NAD(P)-dependent oxidoreductase [Solirubrobacteraceae bacterium]
MQPLSEQTILVTGATDGLGRGVAAALAADGATLLLHGRSRERLDAVVEEIGAETGNTNLRAYRADLASLDEVRGLAEDVLAHESRLDALVNNAGIGTTLPGDGERMVSADGHELRFAVNYLSGFLLTHRLTDLLTASAPARVVNVSSAGQGPIDFDDVMLERGYSGGRAYVQSKLAQVMFTIDLAEELRDRGVTVNCLHPATYMPTKMVLHARGEGVSPLEDGVRATVRLVASPDLDGVTGRYFNGEVESDPHPQANDSAARDQLRRLSNDLTGLG